MRLKRPTRGTWLGLGIAGRCTKSIVIVDVQISVPCSVDRSRISVAPGKDQFTFSERQPVGEPALADTCSIAQVVCFASVLAWKDCGNNILLLVFR